VGIYNKCSFPIQVLHCFHPQGRSPNALLGVAAVGQCRRRSTRGKLNRYSAHAGVGCGLLCVQYVQRRELQQILPQAEVGAGVLREVGADVGERLGVRLGIC